MNPLLSTPIGPASADVICYPLPVTGIPLAGILGLAVVLVVGGALLVIASRRGRRARTAALTMALVLLPAPLVVGQPTPASANVLCPPTSGTSPTPPPPSTSANPSGGPTGTARVVVVQTSVNAGMAPGVRPTPLFGEVRNTSGETVYVTDVVVRVTDVTKAPRAAAGPCGPSDYRVTGDRMPVGAVLTPGQKVTFAGARIGFFNKSVNQDACKGAIVALGYTSS